MRIFDNFEPDEDLDFQIFSVFGTNQRINTDPIAWLLRHECMHRLDNISQLGLANLTFPSANGTRLEHSVHAYWFTFLRLQATLSIQPDILSQEEVEALCVAALLHDVGHGPLSHLTDPFVKVQHDERGLEMVPWSLLVEHGVNTQMVREIMERKHPLSWIIYHPVVGAEKLAYLWVDCARCWQPMMDFKFFMSAPFAGDPHEGVVIDVRYTDWVRMLYEFMRASYKNIYYRRSVILGERQLMQHIYQWIQVGECTEEVLVRMTDDELIQAMLRSSDTELVRQVDALVHHRGWWRAFAVVSCGALDGFASRGKPITPLRLSKREWHLVRCCTFEQSLVVQERLSEYLGFPVMVTTAPPSRRFEAPTGLMVGTNAGPMPFVQYYPDWARAVEKEQDQYVAVYISCKPENREAAAKAAASPKFRRVLRQIYEEVVV